MAYQEQGEQLPVYRIQFLLKQIPNAFAFLYFGRSVVFYTVEKKHTAIHQDEVSSVNDTPFVWNVGDSTSADLYGTVNTGIQWKLF
jgi:hypothetical protein